MTMLAPTLSTMRPKALAVCAARMLALHDLPGLAFALVEEGELRYEQSFGCADRGTGARLEPSHVFQAASLTKMITAWTVSRLVEQGRMALDAPVMRYVSRWRLPAQGFDPDAVTVRRVLGHRAGLSLPDYPGFEPSRALPCLEASLSGETNGGGDLRIVRAPGTRFEYSGGGFSLLALAIEELTGMAFADHVTRAVFGPLGMAGSSLDQSIPERAATGHDATGRPLPFFRYDGAAAAGLSATVGDLARFAAAHMPGPAGEPAGRGVLAPASIRAMTSSRSQTGRTEGLWAEYGLGCEIEALADGRTLIGHHGLNRGWRALLAADPDAGRAIVLLANSDAAMPALDELLRTWLQR